MNILFIVPRFHTNLYYRIKSLIDKGHNVHLIVQYQARSECYNIIKPKVIGYAKFYIFLEKLRKKIFKKEAGDFWKLHLGVPNLKELKNEIKNFKADIAVIRGTQSLFTFLTLYYVKKNIKNIFLLAQSNKHYAESRKKKMFLFTLKNFFKVKKIITPLKNILNSSDSYFKFIPFVIETKDFKKEYFRNNKINIVSVGKFVSRKDHLILLKAVNALKHKYNISLTIIGEKRDQDVLNNIVKFIEKNDLLKIVNLKFDMAYSDVLECYKNYDLFVLPSYNEPAAYSILEAMANKLPVICSDDCGTKCYIEDGENGYIFKKRDLKNLTDKIEKIIFNKNKLVKMGKNSFEMILKKYSATHFVDNFEEILNY